MDDPERVNPMRYSGSSVPKKSGPASSKYGHAAGVGKTYQMLHAAQSEAMTASTFCGYVEPPDVETEALVLGLDIARQNRRVSRS
jgi:K+-sensing histidine kinase KdpD